MQTHRLEAALRASGQILYEWDPVTDGMVWAGSMKEVLGYDLVALPTFQAWSRVVNQADLAVLGEAVDQALVTGETFRLEYRVRRPDGTDMWVQDTGRFVDPRNPRSGMIGTVVDVTARRQAEDEIHASRRVLEKKARQASHQRAALLALSSRPTGEFTEALGTILRTAAETLQVTRVGYWAFLEDVEAIQCEQVYPMTDGVPRGTLAATDFVSYFTALRRNEVIAVYDVATDPRTACLPLPVRAPSPTRALLDVPVWIDGKLSGIVCHELEDDNREWTAEDQEFAISIAQHVAMALASRERRRMEGQLRMADRMVSVGTLCAGVAHEINNPLAYTLGNLSFIRESLQDGQIAAIDDLREAVADAIDGANRVRDVVRDLRTFARPDEERLGPVRVAQVLDVAQRMAMAEIRHRARVVVDARDVPPVLGNDSRLGQVLVNLLVNAAQAMPERPMEKNEIRVSVRHSGARVTIEVADNGVGIAPEAVERVFDPFYTTKSVGQGTGLGLFVCHGIVTGMGGEIDLESRAGQGTTFRVHLPVAPGLALMSAPGAGAGSLAGPAARLRRVLVIDDEPRVGSAIARMLASWSEVETVIDPHEGMRRILDGEAYDAVLCDLMMPGMTGMELHARIEAADPARAAGIVFITGGAVTRPAMDFLKRMDGRALEKPFDAAVLRGFLDRTVAATGSPSCSLPTTTSTSGSCA